jgi:hypothetical protein
MGVAISAGAEDGNGTTQALSGGRGPAQGLWQFEPPTWRQYAPPGAPPTATGATPLQQAQAFVRDVNANKGYASWAPDLGLAYGTDPTTARPGSPVAAYLGTHHASLTGATKPAPAWGKAPGTSGAGSSGGLLTAFTPFVGLEQWLGSVAARVGLVIFGAVLVVVGVIMLLRGAHTEELRVVTDAKTPGELKAAGKNEHAGEAARAAAAAAA